MPQTETQPDTIEAADDALLSGQDEALETPTPEPVETTASPAPATTGQPRDESGRFAPKAPTAPETPAPSEPSPSAESPAEPAVEVPAEPFRYRGDGQEIEIPGSQVGEDGIFIPAAEVPRIQQLLAEGQAWGGSAQQYLQENNRRQHAADARAKAADERTAAVEAQLTQVLGHFEQLVEQSSQYPVDQLMQSPMGQWLMDIRNNWGVLKAESKAARIEREAKAYRDRVEQFEQSQREAELKPQMAKTLSDYILSFGAQAQLSREVMEDIYATLNSPEYEGVTWIKAPQDDPLNQITKGETVLNVRIVEREVQRAKKWRPAPTTNGTPPKQSAPAAPVKKPTPPPTVSATRGPTPKRVLAEPTSKEEADRWLSEGGNDPD